MTQETRIALVLVRELLTALRANDPDTFRRRLYGASKTWGILLL